MAASETGMEWLSLRSLVNSNPWDYCVIWRLGDDPSRFIQWGTCCCNGGSRVENFKCKEESGLPQQLSFGECCRDEFVKHSVRTVACKKLAQLPFVIPLYSGIHGDVVTSRQPVWTVPTKASASDNELNGTQVLIPVSCGLIEFFSSNHVPRDDKFIDYVSACFKQDKMIEKVIASLSLKERFCEPDPYDCPVNWSLHDINSFSQTSQPNNYSSFEGSSTCSSLSNEQNQALKLGSDRAFGSLSPSKPSREHFDSPMSNAKLKRKKSTDSMLVHVDEKVSARNRQSTEKGPYKSKNLVTERNRRKRIKAGMFALRALVPKITKMDRVATLGDAADYIEELHKTIESYNNQLQAMEDEECSKDYGKSDLPKLIRDCAEKKTGAADKTPLEVQVEVSQLGARDFLVKLVCEHRRGGFSSLMEAMDSLGLDVIDANVTAVSGSMLNVLRVESNRKEVDARSLKLLLIQLVT